MDSILTSIGFKIYLYQDIWCKKFKSFNFQQEGNHFIFIKKICHKRNDSNLHRISYMWALYFRICNDKTGSRIFD